MHDEDALCSPTATPPYPLYTAIIPSLTTPTSGPWRARALLVHPLRTPAHVSPSPRARAKRNARTGVECISACALVHQDDDASARRRGVAALWLWRRRRWRRRQRRRDTLSLFHPAHIIIYTIYTDSGDTHTHTLKYSYTYKRMKTRSTVDGNLAFYLHYARAMCVYDAFSNSSSENHASSSTPNITCGP